jgi:solute carrier family 25 aspartate/glutamate transporter 12/13
LQRLSLLDFAQLLVPRWKAPHEHISEAKPVATSVLQNLLHRRTVLFRVICDGVLFHWLDILKMGFVGIAGSVGATIVYPIDMGKFL